MPKRGSGHNHAFFSSRNQEQLRRSIEVSHVTLDNGKLLVTVRTVGVGHRFPTGDIFRKLTVNVSGLDPKGATICTRAFAFHRNWAAHAAAVKNHTEETLDQDGRLDHSPRTLSLACPGIPASAHVSITYDRGELASEGHFESFESTLLHDGRYPLDPE